MNVEQLAIASLDQVPANHLVLTVGYNPTLFWIVEATDKSFAVFLTGDHAKHAFASSTAENWAGVSIGPVELRVNPSSANSGEGDTKWQLKARQGTLAFPALMKPHGFAETVWLPIIGLTTTGEQTVYFSQWSIGLSGKAPAQWTELARVWDGKLTTDLLVQE